MMWRASSSIAFKAASRIGGSGSGYGAGKPCWIPARRPAFLAAADARVLGDSGRELRLGYSHNGINRGAQERGVFLGSQYDRVEARAAYLRTSAAGRAVSRIRTGLALHYNRFVVGVAREEGASGLGPLYQFTLSTILR